MENIREKNVYYFCVPFSLVFHIHIQANAIFHPGGAGIHIFSTHREKSGKERGKLWLAHPRSIVFNLHIIISTHVLHKEITSHPVHLSNWDTSASSAVPSFASFCFLLFTHPRQPKNA